MKQPLLTIAIPTYNRASYLEVNLSQLWKNWVELEQQYELEIVVSNNASTDHTNEVVNSFINKGLPISYIINEINIGADGNFEKCFSKASGKYVWIFGDDELLFNHSLAKIMDVLKNNDIGCLYLEGVSYADTYDLNAYNMQPTETVKLISCDEYIQKVHFYLTFCTGNIFNKSILPSNFDSKKFIGTNLNQVNWYLTALNHAEKSIILNEKYFYAKNANTGGYKLFKTFSTDFNLILKHNTTPRHIKWINNQLINSFFPIFLNQRQSFSKENGYLELLKNYYHYPLFWKKLVLKQIIKYIKKKLK